MLRNLGIRWQILSALALPVLVLGLISAQVTRDSLADMDDAGKSRDLARAAGAFADLASSLQAERALSVGALLDQSAAKADLAAARQKVDQQLTALGSVRSDVAGTGQDAVFSRSEAAHRALPGLRAQVDGGDAKLGDVITGYSAVIAPDVAGPADLTVVSPDATTRASFEQFALLGQAGEAMAQEQLVGIAVLRDERVVVVNQRALAAAQALWTSTLDTFRRQSAPEQRQALDGALAPAGGGGDLPSTRTALLAVGQGSGLTVDTWTSVTEAQMTGLRKTIEVEAELRAAGAEGDINDASW